MKSIARLLLGLTVCCLSAISVGFAEDAAPPAKPVSFYRQVRPILQRHCSGCHQPAKLGGNLQLISYELFQKGGDGGPSFISGKPDESLIVKQISGEKPEMPLNSDPLSEKQVATIRTWIAQGATDDTPATAKDDISAEKPPVYTSAPVITALSYSPDSQLLAISGYHEVLLHHADGSGLAARLVGRSPTITSIRFSPDGTKLAVAGGAPSLFGEIQIWDVAKKELIRSDTIGFDTLYGLCFNDEGTLLAYGTFDNRVRAIQVADGKQVMSMDAHTDLVFGTTFSLKNDHVISVSRDMSMKLTELKTSQFIDNITSITPGALKGGIMAVQRHPKEEQVLIGGADGEPKLYKIFRTQARQIGDDFNRLRSYTKLPGRVCSLQFNVDGTKFVVGSSNATSGAARIYKTDTEQPQAELKGQTAGVFAVAFRPDGQQVVTGGLDGVVRMYNAETGELVKEFSPVTLSPAVAAAQ
ncbi:c-type cytochrome domain-containing protein [Schlesneria paludicola]|uniref:c-type cytochrome domain-containing protein n=1 Tax=Schlesneria paludicola TaxID=360056 RepID=UPI00029A7AD8|nr:c-type cytochrome domain-containing protein [Schlesneria paludicola]